MSSGMYYNEYLKLDELLTAQQPVSQHPDELHFIVVHQVHELWFKLALHHLERARTAMQEDDLLEAARLVQQVVGIFENLRQTALHLHTLPPPAFHRFRQMLAPGSGLQSYQFREIEFLGGARDPRHVAWVKRQLESSHQWERVHHRLEEPSLAEVFDEVLARHHIPEVAHIYAEPHQYTMIYTLADALSELDHQIQAWRYAHIQLVQRTIGTGTVGTGGTTHDYLLATLKVHLFPALWAARDRLTSWVDHGTIEIPKGYTENG